MGTYVGSSFGLRIAWRLERKAELHLMAETMARRHRSPHDVNLGKQILDPLLSTTD
ncbi:hypothetical protein C5167_031450 [Papaver somniferum]|uniref:Uncharacterized protein n=1 Tax=Papaver somniferum TaxID=3469 RepID=A0A4Y7K4B7_PAPSO|nr:hypothetical protein C5167_031450 [Papaver somniferum]